MKVLIVGAGIAGPTLAYWLLQAGHEPTLVERAPELPRGGYLVDFWGAGFDVAERMGIVPELRRRGYVLTEARAVDRDGHRIASAVMGSTQRYLSIARSDLAAVIYGALQDRAELIKPHPPGDPATYPRQTHVPPSSSRRKEDVPPDHLQHRGPFPVSSPPT
jgi:2-polyprenyl-6-methoxyphenol hydroxylase-like FAD-dependent oxidoreductase